MIVFLSGNYPIKLFGYTNSDWIGDTVERKSILGYAFLIASRLFSWSSNKQQIIVLFTTKTEYIAVANSTT